MPVSNPYWLHTPEIRAKISKANRGRPLTPEHREKLRQAKLNSWQNPDYRQRMSATHKGHKPSPESLEKRSAAISGENHWNWQGGKPNLTRPDTSWCSRCKTEKLTNTFPQNPKRRGRPHSRCKSCLRIVEQAYRLKHREEIQARARLNYAANREKRQAYSRAYRTANLEKTQDAYKRWYAANKRKRQVDRLQRLYGLTPEELEKLHQAQNGKCGICGKDGRLVVDHDHITGKVRGLLHNTCNTGLGRLGDNREGVLAALAYLDNTNDNGLLAEPTPPPLTTPAVLV